MVAEGVEAVRGITVLRSCEAETINGVGMAPVVCGEAGQWWQPPVGDPHVLCDRHLEMFETVVGAE